MPEQTGGEHDTAPPPYVSDPSSVQEDNENIGTHAEVAQDGRVNINIDQRTQKLSQLLPQIQPPTQEELPPPPYIPPSLGGSPDEVPPPSMNVVIHVVGSRGDVQPFVALGKVLKDTYGYVQKLKTGIQNSVGRVDTLKIQACIIFGIYAYNNQASRSLGNTSNLQAIC